MQNLVVSRGSKTRSKQLRAELAEVSEELRKVEAALAEEQAAVNRFRMHCRLKIGVWVDSILELRSRKQALWTQLHLRRQSTHFGTHWSADDPFWEQREHDFPLDDETMAEQEAERKRTEERVLLPTDVPRDKKAEKRIYRELAKRFHPDRAGSAMEQVYATSMMAAVNVAYEAGDFAALRDLAGEPDPEMVARYSGGDTAEEKRLRKRILGCRRRIRKVTRQFQTMKKENTARLWRKAQQMEADGLAWWEEVRRELEEEEGVLSAEIKDLEGELHRVSQR